ncbi:MAG: ribosomal-processing cysteine protease Prp [Lachnospiraceae bacterium]|nr:ribosomal-processing cysteine protease Prp [Lachnospiraceae bacterium]
MITVTLLKKADKIVGFISEGHAAYDDSGKDIVCAAVSILVINTVNSIERFTLDEFEADQDAEDATITFSLKNPDLVSEKAEVLLNALELGIKGISAGNDEYLQVISKEV